jgi:hypothetical protein
MSSIPKGTLRNGVRRIIAVAIGCWLVMIAGVVMAQDASNPTGDPSFDRASSRECALPGEQGHVGGCGWRCEGSE